MTKLTRTRLLATTMIVGAAAVAAPLSAQANSANQPNNPVTQATEAGASTGPIEGQTPASGSDMNQGAGDQGTIIVTGSRIPQPNLTSAAPVSVVTAQEVRLQGTTRVEDLLNTLPQVSADQNGGLANGATGTATVNLRNLGAQRTLVLVNGRRLLPGDPNSSAADLNNIPSSLIKSVQVLTGGASSTYGADAVAGVVNFIMDTDYTGFKVDGQYSFFQHDNSSNVLRPGLNARQAAGLAGFGYPSGNGVDGGNIDTNVTLGTGFDDNRGHIVAYAGYRRQRAISQADRDYSACTAQAAATGGPVCGGSLTSQTGTFFDGNSSSYQVNSGRTFTPGFTRYNFAPTNYYQRPDERYTAGFFAHYDISDAIKPYTEFMFMDDRTVAQIAPSGDFGNTFSINCDNPLLSAQQLAIACAPGNLVNGFVGSTFPTTVGNTPANGGALNFTDPTTGAQFQRGYLNILRRNVEGGNRQDDLQHTSYRGVIGSKGDIAKGFAYDGYYQYGRTVFSETYSNDFSIQRLTRALDVVTSPTTGQPVCRSALAGTDTNCVPYDIFSVGGVTPAATNYLSTPGFQRAIVSEQVAHVDFTFLGGEYGLKSPLADDGLGVNFGFEHRRERLEFRTDQAFTQGDLAGQGAATLSTFGGFVVNEAFVEAQLPLIHDNFIYDLSLEGGYRYSKYHLDGGGGYTTNTYKFAGTFAPVKDITFRAAYNRAVRAPNIQELFEPQHVALDGTVDPCAGAIGDDGTVNGYTAAQCANTGVTAAQFGNITENPAAQYNGLIGGTSSLRPEKATTKTAGVVIQPRFLPRLALTADYYDIKVTKAIGIIGSNTILQSCASGGDAGLCSLINRNPVNGSLWLDPGHYVTDLNLNTGGVHTRGVDFTGSYTHEIGRFGTVGFNVSGTYLDKFVTDPGVPGSTPYDCKGFYGATCGVPLPKWKGKARLTYTAPFGIQLSGQWRYLNHVNADRTSDNPALAAAFSQFSSRIKSQSYFDLSSTATIGDHYLLTAGVNNIADKRPPVVNSNGALSNCASVVCSGNTYPGIYDYLGRYLYVRIGLEF
ncbi:TonB-dependent receptor domain-containing protein [Sphingomonas sp.]|uniref:TonB-dependent receptor domain-containing protein n=1 Tax=Sphingomonas sp. TaxID=28214 RepID=UPI003AFFD8AD